MQSTLSPVSRWCLLYPHPCFYCRLSCPLPLPVLCSVLCTRHPARQGSVCRSVCPALPQLPFHDTFRVCLPLAVPLPPSAHAQPPPCPPAK